MFDLEPISTTNLFTLAQIIVVIAGFIFAWKSLKATRDSVVTAGNNVALATRNAQAQLVNQMMVQGRELQIKFIDLFLSEETDKQKQFTGTVIGYHASCFELRKVLEVPENIAKLLDADLRELMLVPYVQAKWHEIKHMHSQKFIEHVDGLRGVR